MVNAALFESAGRGGAANKTAAALWFGSAARLGDVRAQRMWGACLMDGNGVPIDRAEAVRWYARAARANDTKAQFNLGVCYQQGTGVREASRRRSRRTVAVCRAPSRPAQHSKKRC
jgi:TPR repeat protein